MQQSDYLTHSFELTVYDQFSAAARVTENASTLTTVVLTNGDRKLLFTSHTFLYSSVVHPLRTLVVFKKLSSIRCDRRSIRLFYFGLALQLFLSNIIRLHDDNQDLGVGKQKSVSAQDLHYVALVRIKD